MMELEWIDCDSRAPESSDFYIICLEGEDIATYGYYDAAVGDWFTHFIDGECMGNVTFWMSFPCAPDYNF